MRLAEITWCPGCTNFVILATLKRVIAELGLDKRKVVVVSGIGCHGKISDYVDTSSFITLHGRVIPTATGIKLANPELTVLGFAGDGDTYAEGLAHFISACRMNPDIKLFVHNNQVFALTVGQPTPTSEPGFVSRARPEGVKEPPFNPVLVALTSGATFVARTWTEPEHLRKIMIEAIKHKGFAFVDILQPCITFHDTREFFRERVYDLQEAGHDPSDFGAALEKAREWNYTLDPKARIPIGVFYKTSRPTLGEVLRT